MEPHQPQGGLHASSFDSDELVGKCVKALEDELNVTPLQYTIQRGEQADEATYDASQGGRGVQAQGDETETNTPDSIHSAVKYDLIGKLAEDTQLTRRTVADILKGINVAVFAQYKTNPEDFIAEAARLINEQKATVIVEHLAYDPVDETLRPGHLHRGTDQGGLQQGRRQANRHIYDYVFTDSKIERKFVEELDTSARWSSTPSCRAAS